MSAVMKTVLPARESPVTPSRIWGPVAKVARLCAAARASKRRSEINGKTSLLSRSLHGEGAPGGNARMGRANASRSVVRETRFCHIQEHDLVELQAFWTISYIKSMIYGEASYQETVDTLLRMSRKSWGAS